MKYFVRQHGKTIEISEERYDEILDRNPNAHVWQDGDRLIITRLG